MVSQPAHLKTSFGPAALLMLQSAHIMRETAPDSLMPGFIQNPVTGIIAGRNKAIKS